jgi:hypothetical protein
MGLAGSVGKNLLQWRRFNVHNLLDWSGYGGMEHEDKQECGSEN